MKLILLGLALLALTSPSSAQAKGKYDDLLDLTAYGYAIDDDWLVGLFGKGRAPTCIDSAGIYTSVTTMNENDARAQPFEVGLLLKIDSTLFRLEGKGQPKTTLLSTVSYMRYVFPLTLEQLSALRGAAVVSLRFVDGIPKANTTKRTLKTGSWEKYPPTCVLEPTPADTPQRQ